MKINILLLSAPVLFGGAENVILSIDNLLNKKRMNVHHCLFLNPKRAENYLHKKLLENNSDVSVVFLKKAFDLSNILDLLKILKNKKINIIHTHGYRSDMIGLICSKIMNIPIISTAHGWTSSSKKVIFYERINRMLLKYFNKITPVSREIEDILISKKVMSSKIKRISNCINFETYSISKTKDEIRQEYQIKQGTVILGIVGRLSEEKGHEFLLNVLQKLKKTFNNFKLLIVGEGNMESFLVERVKVLKLQENVVFCGFQKEIANFYNLFDVLILSSLTEGVPLVILEAMYYRTPIISSNVGGISEIIHSGINGYLYTPGDVTDLYNHIVLLCTNRAISDKIIKNAYNYLINNHNPKKWIAEIEKIYCETYEESQKDRLQQYG